ncbi:hypothetical protein HZC32_01375, partial [Candidatus Woesearchaeota archaeon]|nr:hypothetical protein [Candidatus Woesearchaeota archaeon]
MGWLREQMRANMKSPSHLEEILQRFEQQKERFRNPRLLSFENEDVTIKYPLAMLSLAENRKKEEIIYGFCTEKTFTNDQQDQLLAMARIIPLNLVLKEMSKQFRNWTTVTDVEVETNRALFRLNDNGMVAVQKKKNVSYLSKDIGDLKKLKEEEKFEIRRRTLPKYKEALRKIVGNEKLEEILLRDCHLSYYAFIMTFQKLYGQKDLRIERLSSETEGASFSTYHIYPSAPYQSLIWKMAKGCGNALLWTLLPLKCYLLWKENRFYRKRTFGMEEAIKEMSKEIKQKNIALQKEYDQNIVLLQKVAELKQSGDRHSIRNALSLIAQEEKELITDEITNYINITYQLVARDEMKRLFVIESCSHFGISEEMLKQKSLIQEQLGKVIVREDIRKELLPDEGQKNKEQEPVVGEYLVDLFSDEVMFDLAYEGFKETQKKFCGKIKEDALESFDPFALFGSLLNSERVINTINAKLISVDISTQLDEVDFFTLASSAAENAEKDKKTKLTLVNQLEYNPTLKTKKEALERMLEDICYNTIDAGGDTLIL